MDQPFEVGKAYRNRHGAYVVLAIEAPRMRIRYENGHEDVVTIDIQARIWQAIEDEARQHERAAAKPPVESGKRRRPARQGYGFCGLQEGDFKHNVTGTHWRSRENLGGRLAQHLSETTRHEFQSHSIYRRPSVYITMPDRYDPHNGVAYAKLELSLFPEGARYGFYVERADRSRPMDSTWHWRPFIKALELDGALQAQLLGAMREHELFWSLQVEEGELSDYSVVQEVKVRAASPLLWDESDSLDWPGFADRLRAFPEWRWLNVHLCAWTDKQDAIDAGERFEGKVTRVFQSLLPLYLASSMAR